MKNQEALETLSFMLNRVAMNRAEVAGVNASLWKLKESLVDGDPLDELGNDKAQAALSKKVVEFQKA